jgi:hypothetical protein
VSSTRVVAKLLRAVTVMLLASLPTALVALPVAAQRAARITDPLTTVRTLQVEGQVVIDPSGHVADYRVTTPVPHALQATVDEAVRGWRFYPVQIDGQARRVQTRMRITLAATASSDGYQVRVDNVVFPGPESARGAATLPAPDEISGRKLTQPLYPPGLLRAGVSGVVLLAIQVSADGTTADAAVVQTMLLDVTGRERVLQQAVALLERSSLSAVRSWRYNVPDALIKAGPEQRIVTHAIHFVFDSNPPIEKAGMWRTVVRTPKRAIAWVPASPGSQSAGVTDIASGEFLPVATDFRLASEVIGKLL